MAGAGYKVWSAGDVLAAAEVNTYLMQQTIMVFAGTAARASALGTVVSEGMFTYLMDTNALEYYNGTTWSGAALPAQSGNAGKYLTTNGTAASWASITTDPNAQIFMMMGA
jgi:hypothetical protein